MQSINELGRKARDGALSIDDMAGGTFTIRCSVWCGVWCVVWCAVWCAVFVCDEEAGCLLLPPALSFLC